VNDASIALVGGRIRTRDAAGTIAEAVYIERGFVAAVGNDEQIQAVTPAGVPVVQLDGRTALPGLIEAHAHVELSKLADHFWVVVRELAVDATLGRLRDAIATSQRIAGSSGREFGQQLPTRQGSLKLFLDGVG
jgi:predicted amidohydrolase YtcJ